MERTRLLLTPRHLTGCRQESNVIEEVQAFKNTIYHLSGVVYCVECGLKYHGVMIISNHRKGIKKAWYRCSSRGVPYIKCTNGQIKADELHAKVFEILNVLAEQNPVKEEFEDLLRKTACEPNEHYAQELGEKEKHLARNLKKQSELFDLFKEDRINIEVYREKADELRREEAVLKKDIRDLQISLIDRQRGIDDRLRVQYFLRSLQEKDHKWSEADKKEFVRIIFKKIVIKDGEIVSDLLEMNPPWNLLYEKRLQCQKKQLSQKRKTESSQYVCTPSAARWQRVYTLVCEILRKLYL